MRPDLGDGHDRIESIIELRENIVVTSGPIKVRCRYEYLAPIPITEEWLIRGGFEKSVFEKSVKSWTILKKDEWFTIYDDLNFGNQCIYGRTIVKYVHQLQNLYYALTNQELKFNP